jgi:hypothetical protein
MKLLLRASRYQDVVRPYEIDLRRTELSALAAAIMQ